MTLNGAGMDIIWGRDGTSNRFGIHKNWCI